MAYEQKKWLEFLEQGQAALLQGQFVEYKPTIQLLVEPSFGNPIFLQFHVYRDKLYWLRRTWFKTEDNQKFADLIENLKYIGQTITPTIQQASGEADSKLLQPIITFIYNMSIKTRFNLPDIVIDGVYYSLTIGTSSNHSTYTWNSLPEEWTDLQKLADMILELNQQL